jgi:class 3 adenylate cyclase/TolB-like protein/Flp pilus assembly protein TadD
MPPVRQLAAIMFTDIAGYTALMGKDEDSALSLLDINRKIQRPLITKHNGKFVKELGDGVLAHFNSAYDAVKCAMEIQECAGSVSALKIRIGIHLGDVTMENDDVFGDGVNVASRIQGIADPGGIYVSASIENAVQNRLDIITKYLGEAELKNVEHPTKIFAIQGEGLPIPAFKPKTRHTRKIKKIESLVILPFANLTGTQEQDYIVEGIHDALISEVSHIGSLRVISRTSAMKYVHSVVPIPQIAKELGVDGVVETSMLRTNGKIRLNVQLIRVSPQEDHIWAGYFDDDMRDIFSMISRITRDIAQKIEIALSPREQQLITPQLALDPELYKLYLRGRICLSHYTPEGFQKGIQILNEVIERDPTCAPAYATLSIGYGDLAHLPAAPQEAFPRAKALAKKALELNSDLAEAQTAMAECNLYHDFQIKEAKKHFELAIGINPNYAPAVSNYGWLLDLLGKKAEAEIYLRKAADLDPLAPIYRAWLGWWYWEEKRYEEGIDELKRILAVSPGFPVANMVLGGIYADIGKYDEAISLTKKASEDFPGLDHALGVAYIRAGRRSDAEALVARLDKTPFNAFSLMIVNDELGIIEDTLKWMQVVSDIRHVFAPWVAIGFFVPSLNNDPRVQKIFKPILDSIGEAKI